MPERPPRYVLVNKARDFDQYGLIFGNLVWCGLATHFRDHHTLIIHLPDIVEILVAHGADINMQNNTGQTAMHFAKYYEYDEIFSYLKSMGADDSIRNHDGFTCYEGLHEDVD